MKKISIIIISLLFAHIPLYCMKSSWESFKKFTKIALTSPKIKSSTSTSSTLSMGENIVFAKHLKILDQLTQQRYYAYHPRGQETTYLIEAINEGWINAASSDEDSSSI